MKSKKIFALISLALSLSLTAQFAACGEAAEKPTDDSESDTSDIQSSAELTPDIPSDLDLGGETVTILYREAMKDEFWTEEQNGDVVNDAVYDRNIAVENQLNCKLEYIPNPSTDWGGGYQSMISDSVLAGDEAYDIISGPSFHIPTLIVDGYLYNLNGLNYVDFEKPWWTQSLLETTAFGDKIYLVSGDISMGMLRYLHCTYYNMSLGADYGFEDLYDVVLDGRWTLDMLEKLCKDKYQDINNNGSVDHTADSFGYLISNTTLWRAYIDALDVDYFRINNKGIPEFNFSDQRSFDVCERFTKLIGSGSSGDLHMANTSVTGSEVQDVFKNNRAIFVMGRFVDCENQYRDMKSDFAILPVPKWDENQESYEVTINGSESTFGVPVNSSKTEYIGAVLELLAYHSYDKVTPAYYESALKIKYTRGDNMDKAAQVIDIIRNGAKFNPTVQLSKLLGGTDYMIQEAFTNGTGLASKFAARQTELEAKLAEVLDKIS